MGHNNGHWSLLFLWDRLGFDAGLELAIDKVLDKCSNVLFSKRVAIKGIFLILDGFLDGESGEFVGRKI